MTTLRTPEQPSTSRRGSTRPRSARNVGDVLGNVRRAADSGGQVRPRGSAQRAVARARRRAFAAFAATVSTVLGVLVLVMAKPATPATVLVAVLVALLAGVAAAVVTDRWTRSRFVDLRHHDLLEGLRRGVVPDVVDLTTPNAQDPHPSDIHDEGPAPTHQLFGDCDCAACRDGLSGTATPNVGRPRPAPARQVIDLRSGARRAGRVRLGQRPDQTG